eukprot:7366287-Alexandrium_andersonii.AAC.1
MEARWGPPQIQLPPGAALLARALGRSVTCRFAATPSCRAKSSVVCGVARVRRRLRGGPGASRPKAARRARR